MNKKEIPGSRSDCPISYTLDLIGDKWTLLILRDMFLFGMRTYSEILNSREKIASNTARDRLTKLIENGFIALGNSHARKWNRPYIVTEKGMELIPIIMDMAQFGVNHGLDGGVAETVRKGMQNREKAIERIRTGIEKVNKAYSGEADSKR